MHCGRPCEHDASEHLIWILASMYHGQHRSFQGNTECSQRFRVNAGVRQGCVLSPRLFGAVLQLRMKSWRDTVAMAGVDLGDGLPCLFDLRFANDILIFATSFTQVHNVLNALITALARVGLQLNAEKAVILTTEAQPPYYLVTAHGHGIKILPRNTAHRWLRCMLSASGSRGQGQDLDAHISAASKACLPHPSEEPLGIFPCGHHPDCLFRSGVPDCAPI